jgi:hypothetical protein
MLEQFAEKFPEIPVPNRIEVRRFIEKFREKGSVLDAERCGRHHFQHLLQVHSDFPKALHQNHSKVSKLISSGTYYAVVG